MNWAIFFTALLVLGGTIAICALILWLAATFDELGLTIGVLIGAVAVAAILGLVV